MDSRSRNDPNVGQRVDVLWHRGNADVWYPGTLLDGGRVEIDNPGIFVMLGPFILQPEEIAESVPPDRR